MLWDLGNKKGSKGEAHTAYYGSQGRKPNTDHYGSQGQAPTAYYTTKIETILKTTK